jgi:hypothetical protein
VTEEIRIGTSLMAAQRAQRVNTGSPCGARLTAAAISAQIIGTLLLPGGRGDGGLVVVVAEQAHHGRGRGVLALLLSRADDEPGGDLAQALVLGAQVESGGTARTSRYRADGIDVCWVSTGRWPPWMETVP